MCTTCGCNPDKEKITIIKLGDDIKLPSFARISDPKRPNPLARISDPKRPYSESPDSKKNKTIIEIEQDILHENNLLAERNRGYFEAKNILALNLVSSPGSGKTALLETTLKTLGNQHDFYVVEGDQQTSNDADRIAAAGAPVVQINTGKGCHLDAGMVNRAVKKLNPAKGAILLIENVGNLVCPAAFDLGENFRVVIISVTEGTDKPIKYPDMFHSSQLCIINKIDLLPYVDFDVDTAKKYARQVNHQLEFIELSATTQTGMQQWYDWLAQKLKTISE